MAKSSKRWLQEQQRDQFVQQARRSRYRSRAVYKLQEIDEKDRLFRPGQVIVDLGAAPGSWSQYARNRIGSAGKLIAVDILPMEPLPEVLFIQGDFTQTAVLEDCIQGLPDGTADLVISDMAPNLTGIRSTDQARSMYLAELVHDFSIGVLKPGGDMLVKMFQGQGADEYKKGLIKHFQKLMVRKPKASRDNSREFYILGRGYVV